LSLRLVALLLLAGLHTRILAQNLQLGPIVGGVRPDGARVYVRLDAVAPVTVEASADNFATIAASVTDTTLANEANSRILNLTGLSPRTQYRVRVRINGATQGPIGTFRTFPTPGTPGNYVFLGGSCIRNLESRDTLLFKKAAESNPDLFMFYGDWGYPDSETGINDVFFSNPATSYAANYAKILEAYRFRYSPSVNTSLPILHKTAIETIWDDHDYSNDNSGNNFASAYELFPTVGRPITKPALPSIRPNLIRGFQNHSPSHDLVNPAQGIYRKITLGNMDIFVLDLRSSRTPQHDAIKRVGNEWKYEEPANHTLLGAEQLAWLKQELKNSTADWKILVSGITFNYGNRVVYDSCLKIGTNPTTLFQSSASTLPIDFTGLIAASRFADKWVGYRSEQDALLQFIKDNNILNVFAVSGDTHNAALDDGTNSGIPELMSGNLAVSNRREARESLDFLNYNIWNQGGSGLCTEQNYSVTFSRIETFGSDSIRLAVVDPSGFEVVAKTFKKDEPSRFNPNAPRNFMPKTQNDTYVLKEGETLRLNVLANDTDPEGKPLFVTIGTLPSLGTLTVNPDNSFTYTANADTAGTDRFQYYACDDNKPCPSCREAFVDLTIERKTVSRPENIVNTTFEVYPNPVPTELKIEAVNNTVTPFTFRLFNPLGQVVREATFTGKYTLDVRPIPGGYYIYQIFDPSRRVVQSGKVNVLHY
jgi:phosphodiesterase/alkaline phosphatase D-like protein